jgi:hypothetical protein
VAAKRTVGPGEAGQMVLLAADGVLNAEITQVMGRRSPPMPATRAPATRSSRGFRRTQPPTRTWTCMWS